MLYRTRLHRLTRYPKRDLFSDPNFEIFLTRPDPKPDFWKKKKIASLRRMTNFLNFVFGVEVVEKRRGKRKNWSDFPNGKPKFSNFLRRPLSWPPLKNFIKWIKMVPFLNTFLPSYSRDRNQDGIIMLKNPLPIKYTFLLFLHFIIKY